MSYGAVASLHSSNLLSGNLKNLAPHQRDWWLALSEVISACQKGFVRPVAVRVIEIIRSVLSTSNLQLIGIKKVLRGKVQVFFRAGSSIFRIGEWCFVYSTKSQSWCTFKGIFTRLLTQFKLYSNLFPSILKSALMGLKFEKLGVQLSGFSPQRFRNSIMYLI